MTYHTIVKLADKSKNQIAKELLSINSSEAQLTDSYAITTFVDARGLSCPQPLLKLKLALRSITVNQMIYLVATDANSKLDIQAYANHSNIKIQNWQTDDNDDTIFHFLIRQSDK